MTHTHNKSTFGALALAGLLAFGSVSEAQAMETIDNQLSNHYIFAMIGAGLITMLVTFNLTKNHYTSPRQTNVEQIERNNRSRSKFSSGPREIVHRNYFTNEMFNTVLTFISIKLYNESKINELTIEVDSETKIKDKFNTFLERAYKSEYYGFDENDYRVILNNTSILNAFLLNPDEVIEDLEDNELENKLRSLVVRYYADELKHKHYFMDRVPDWHEAFDSCLNYQFKTFCKQEKNNAVDDLLNFED